MQTESCRRCYVDIDRILSTLHSSPLHSSLPLQSQVRSLKSITGNTSCSLCQFFYQLKTKPGHGSKPWLVALSANRAFFGGVDYQKTLLKDTILLCVSTGGELPPNLYFDIEHSSTRAASGYLPGMILLSQNEPCNCISGRRVPPKIITYDLIRSWISFCGNSHIRTCQQSFHASSLTLINCENRELEHFDKPPMAYTTLSYVCGPITESTDLSLQSAPLTIRDAMTVTEKLGYKYLWVDRYCIPQNNPAERASQIKQMGAIYAGATVTIIAAAGEDPSYGLPGVSSTLRMEQPFATLGKHSLVSMQSAIDIEVDNSKWNSRSWTFQEAILSQKRLVFTDSQVYFQCLAMHCFESVSAPLELVSDPHPSIKSWSVFPRTGNESAENFIDGCITVYERRQLSRESDAFDAFAGILGTFKTLQPPASHFCGLPLFQHTMENKASTKQFLKALCWKAVWTSFVERRPSFPSWTWLGWCLPSLGSIEFDFFSSISQYHIHVEVEVEDGRVLPWSSIRQNLGQGKLHQYLRIRGWTFEVDTLGQLWSSQYNLSNDGDYAPIRSESLNLLNDLAKNSGFETSTGGLVGLVMATSEIDRKTGVLVSILKYSPHREAFQRLPHMAHLLAKFRANKAGEGFVLYDQGQELKLVEQEVRLG